MGWPSAYPGLRPHQGTAEGVTAKPSKSEDNRTKQTTCHNRNTLKTNNI